MPDLISPIVGQQPTVPDLSEFGYTPFRDVQPFSQRAASGYQDQLEAVVYFLQRKLVPYLLASNPQGTWDANVTALIAAVDAALAAQTADNAAKVTAALTAIANSEVVITDPAILAVLNTANSPSVARMLQLFDAHGAAATVQDSVDELKSTFVLAPAPSGGDDTAVLLALINTYGTVWLQPGVYRCNLDITNRFIQPWIIGAGRGFTTLRPFDQTKPVVKFNGGSGAPAGGGIRSVNIDTVGLPAGGIGLAFSGCCFVTAEDINIQGQFAVAVQFWNERTNDFTEFCTFEGAIYNATLPVLYLADNGVESFHGTGIVGNTVIGMTAATGSAIEVRSPALPYESPLSVTVFFQSATDQWLISYENTNTGRHASFYGDVRIENHGSDSNGALGRGSGARVYLLGGVVWFGSGTGALGCVYLANKVTYEGGEILAELKPVSFSGGLKNSPTQFIAGLLKAGELAHIAINVTGPNYHKAYMLTVFQSPYDGTGQVHYDKLFDIDTANTGDPTFSWSGSGLYISNPNFTTSHNIQAQAMMNGAEIRGDNLQQFHQ